MYLITGIRFGAKTSSFHINIKLLTMQLFTLTAILIQQKKE